MSSIASSWTINSPLADVPGHVDRRLDEYLSASIEEFSDISPRVSVALDYLKDFIVGGGKRVRPTFAWAGIRAGLESTDGSMNSSSPALAEELLTAISAFEFIQACALIHDDIIDSSDTRRGNPTVHKRFEAQHREKQWVGLAEHYGVSQAILTGDIALVWADDMFFGCRIPELPDTASVRSARAEANQAWRAMRTEVISGQILDIAVEAEGSENPQDALDVIRYKTASYTVARPLHIGASLVGADTTTIGLLQDIGDDIGTAFQLRDDVLGVFGDPAVTGKPSGDDLISGKRTALINYALVQATPTQAATLRENLGRIPADAEQATVTTLRGIIEDTGALATVEQQIEQRSQQAIDKITAAEFSTQLTEEFSGLARKLTHRTF